MNRTPFAILAVLLALLASSAAFSAWAAGGDDFAPAKGQWAWETIDGERALKVDGSRNTAAPREHFPIALSTGTNDFRSGEVSVRFKPLSGRSDQAGGIMFDYRQNGDYLVLRANALESNLNLYRYASGRRTPLKEVANAPAPAGVWHELRLVIDGSKLRGYLDGKELLSFDLGREVSGGVGLWSKDDSVTVFKDFNVTSAKQ
ncbi:LamG domain-containing protein [Fundidesulfovibrio agrisoli]|uniref:LamG domain-containing protein n=1 Tax=Fundidesulfovibrio agrisoli TaxID=2922717 RepID=UPI001FACD8FF|nr:LamG domain-containing protein [Fundidesulfovibrio agrisoli]